MDVYMGDWMDGWMVGWMDGTSRRGTVMVKGWKVRDDDGE